MIRYFLGTLIAALLFISCNSSSDSTVFVKKDITTTFMVYLPGTDLEADPKKGNGGNGSQNIASMMQAANSNKLNIIVQTGAVDINYTETPTTEYPTPVKDWRNVKRHKVTNNAIKELQNVGKSCLNKPDAKDCIEMGTPEALVDFIRYSVKNYPADRYILVLWDHGAGPIGGYGGGLVKKMDTNDMIKAFDTVKNEVKFDIIGFDTCLLASIELAYNLKGYSKYLLASEELEPGLGWNYGTPLNALAKNPDISNSELGKIFIDEFITLNQTEVSLTLSLTDLSKVEALVNAIDAFSVQASTLFKANKNSQWVKIFTARNKSDEYRRNSLSKSYGNLVDIGDFADILSNESNTDYGVVAAGLKSALKNAIVYNRTDAIHAPSQGLSLYFPFNFNGTPELGPAMDKYNAIYYDNKAASFSKNYRDMTTELLEYVVATESTLAVGLNPTVQGQYLTTEVTSNFSIDTSIVLVDVSPISSEFKIVTARPANVVNTAQENKFNLVAKMENKALALNGFPVYMSLEGRYGLYSQNMYMFTTAAYVLEPDAPELDINNAPLCIIPGIFDFNTSKGVLYPIAIPLNATGRDNIQLGKNVKIMIPDTIGFKDGREKENRKTTNIIPLGEKGVRDVKFELVDLDTVGRLAFYVTDLKGTGKTSKFINSDGTAVTRNFEIDSTDDRDIIAEMLAQPIK